jgi:hypothetical protein
VITFPCELALGVEDNGSDHRVERCPTAAERGQLEGARHPPSVGTGFSG